MNPNLQFSSRMNWLRAVSLLLCAVFVVAYFGQTKAAYAEQADSQSTLGPSGLPLPRFVTLKASRVNMRVGPSQHKYPVKWSYQRKGLPVEIIQEYGNWRRIRDYDGAKGWVNAALLSGRRAAFIAPKQQGGLVSLYQEAKETSPIVIKAEPGVIGKIIECDGKWCQLEINDRKGYISQELLWGVYPDEIIKD